MHFGIGESGVSQVCRRVAQKIVEDKKLKNKIVRLEKQINLSRMKTSLSSPIDRFRIIRSGKATSYLYLFSELQNRPNDKPAYVADHQTILADDLIFHVNHLGRHLGMMEALRGALFDASGSASI